jgi:hypothetical protein
LAAGNPARGQCDITALVVNDLFGGDLMMGEVYLGAEQRGYHWWNRLSTGLEVDLTREQFRHGETITAIRVVPRPTGPTRYRWDEYLLLRRRVEQRLGELPAPGGATNGPPDRCSSEVTVRESDSRMVALE